MTSAAIGDAYGAALGGMQLARQRLADDAGRVAQDPGDVDAIVDIAVEPHMFAANAAVVRTLDEMQRSLFDALA